MVAGEAGRAFFSCVGRKFITYNIIVQKTLLRIHYISILKLLNTIKPMKQSIGTPKTRYRSVHYRLSKDFSNSINRV